MIVVYPMMVSQSISENTLPGVAKMLEAYIAIYMQDDVMNTINGKKFGLPRSKRDMRYKIKRGKIIGESIDLSEGQPPEGFGWDTDPGQGKKDIDDERKRLEKEWKDLEKAERELQDKIKRYEDMKKRLDAEIRRAISDEERNKISRKKLEIDKEIGLKRLELDKKKQEFQQKIAQAKELRDKERHDLEMSKAEKEKKEKPKKIDVRTSDKAITIEPTTIQIHTDDYGTQLLGIKVVPYMIRSDVKLSHLIMHDIQVKGITALTIPLGRQIMGKLLRFSRRGKPVTGDPKQDIIYRTTGHKGETFVALDKNSDVDEYFLNNINKINRLFKFGWGNFVICDDALQLAHFCLRANKGICQGMSYRMMYKTLGQSGVYEDLEDLRKQNSSIFKVSRKRLSKILGEAKSDEKLFNYQERQ